MWQSTKMLFNELCVVFGKSFGMRKFVLCFFHYTVVFFASFNGVLAACLGCLVECSLTALMAQSQKDCFKSASQTSLQFSSLISENLSKHQGHHPPSPFSIVPRPVTGGHRNSTLKDALLQLCLESSVSCLQSCATN